MLYGVGRGDKDLHGESETVSIDEFDIPRRSGGTYDAGPSLNALID